MMLSILVPSIPARSAMLAFLTAKLYSQQTYCSTFHPTLGDVEILVDASKSYRDGGLSIGGKRQALLNRATGKYLCYLDDDEDISPDYVETLLRLCNQDKDVCTFRSFVKVKGFWGLVDMRLENPNEQLTNERITLRSPWHICPVRREFAQEHEFINSNYGEDFQWFENVLTHCQQEAHTDKIIHLYNYGNHSEADQIVFAESRAKRNR